MRRSRRERVPSSNRLATRLRLGYLCEAFGRAAVEDATPTLAGPGAYIHQPVCALHGGHVMLDHEDGIASVLQALQRSQQRSGVGRVQSGRRLVNTYTTPKSCDANCVASRRRLQLAG